MLPASLIPAAAPRYARHVPERTLLNALVQAHYMLWLDGVYEDDVEQPQRKPRLHRTRAPTSAH